MNKPILIIFATRLPELNQHYKINLSILAAKCNCRTLRSAKGHFSPSLNSNFEYITHFANISVAPSAATGLH